MDRNPHHPGPLLPLPGDRTPAAAPKTVRVIGLAGQDYGTDHTVIAAFDFALEAPEGEMLPSLNDLQNTRLKLVRAELGAGLGDDDDDPSLEAVLAELGRILESGPAERETLAPIEA